MKSFKVIAALLLVGVFLLGGLTMAMAAVTSPLEFTDTGAQLSVHSGIVELQKSGSTIWIDVMEPTDVYAGDTIRTGTESEASINVYDQGVLHIAQNSTLTLEESVWDPAEPNVFQGEIFLEAGNLWARLFDFVSPASDFEVRTSSTVATVRGTTFWVGALAGDTSRVYVDDHTVDVRSLVSSVSLEVTDGQMVRLERPGQRPTLRYAAAPTGRDLELIEKYRRWDKEYEADLVARQLAFAHEVRKFDPETSLYNFQRFSERVRLFMVLNEDKQTELRARFMAGRILDAYIEFAERDDITRTKILLQHAQEFGGREIAMRPEVKRAMLFFGRHRVTTPDDLRQEIEKDESKQELQDSSDIKTPEPTPTKITPEPEPEPAAPVEEEVPVQPEQPPTEKDPQPVVQGAQTETVERPMQLDPIQSEPVQYVPVTY